MMTQKREIVVNREYEQIMTTWVKVNITNAALTAKIDD